MPEGTRNRLPVARARCTKRLTTACAAAAGVSRAIGSTACNSSRRFAVESAGSTLTCSSRSNPASRPYSRSHSSFVCATNYSAAAVSAR